MKYIVVTLFLSGILWSSQSHADVIDIAYKDLYSHLRKLDNEDTQQLQFAFGFLKVPEKQTLCQLKNAKIITDKQTLPVVITSEQRFTVPFERALKLADALVQLEVVEPKNQCDISVQLETTSDLLQTTYSQSELLAIKAQYESFFNEMGGFMSFMMPQVSGLQVQFANDDLSMVLPDGLQVISGILRIDNNKINALSEIQLPEKPLRITALTSR